MSVTKVSEFERLKKSISNDSELSLSAKGLLLILYLRGEVDFKRLTDPEYFNAFNELLDSGYISLELTFNV